MGRGVPHDQLSLWTPTLDPSPQGGGENIVLANAFDSTKLHHALEARGALHRRKSLRRLLLLLLLDREGVLLLGGIGCGLLGRDARPQRQAAALLLLLLLLPRALRLLLFPGGATVGTRLCARSRCGRSRWFG